MPAVLTPPAAAPTAPPSPAEYVRSLSPEDRERALVALLALAPRAGGELVSVKLGGRLLGHYIPLPKGDPEELKAILAARTPEEVERGRQALRTVGNSITLDQFLEEMRLEAVAEAAAR